MIADSDASSRIPADDDTRRLCAAAYMDAKFARLCCDFLFGDGLAGGAPPHGIDHVALARHAARADRLDRDRDRVLTAILLFLAVGVVLWAVAAAADHSGLAVLAALGVGAQLGAAAACCVWTALTARRTAQQLVDDRCLVPHDAAPPLPAAVEDVLRADASANAVVYNGTVGAINPFVGSGWRITEAVWVPIDVSVPARDAAGEPLPVKPFDGADLHAYLIEQKPNLGLEDLGRLDRLYVDGRYAPDVPGLVPDPLHRPAPTVSTALLRAGVSAESGYMRTYVGLQKVTRGGSLVVTMHVRARLVQGRLTWETHAYVLPPLSARFYEVNDLPRTPAWLAVRTVLRYGFLALPLTLAAPARLVGGYWHTFTRWWDVRAERRAVRLRREVDYGAVSVLRERAADFDRIGFEERMNTQDYFQRLRDGVLKATELFLDAHNIDTSDLRTKKPQIISVHTYTFTGDITGPGHNFGAWGTQNQQEKPPRQQNT